MKHHYFRFKANLLVVLLLGMFSYGNRTYAQTTLAAGDIAFTAYDSNFAPAAGDEFAFVLLTPISSGTSISFTDRGYTGSGWQAAGSTESTVTWTSGTALPIGTEIRIKGLNAAVYNPTTSVFTTNGTVTLTEGTAPNGLSLSNVGDQIIAFQGGSGSVTGAGVTFIGGIHFFYCNASTTTATWDTGTCPAGPNSSRIPPGLTGGTSAFYTGTLPGNIVANSAKFNCTGTPTASLSTLRAAVMDQANWTLSNVGLTMPAGCTFFGSPAPVVTAHPANKTICAGNNTTFSVTATGATSYQWQVDTGSGFGNISNGGVYSGTTTSTLTITGATAAMSGYQYRAVVTGGSSVNSNAATLTVSNMTASTAKDDVSCFGGSNGAAAVSVSGGITPYTYSWSPAGGTGTTAFGLSAGDYTVTITDNIGCQITRNFTINQPASAVSGTTVVTNVACNGGNTGAINLTPTGGTGPYTFLWNNGATTEDRTGLAAGTYSVTITDDNGCTGTISNITVSQPASAVSGTTVVTNVACFGGNTGAINLTPTGGTGPYTFLWNNGATTEDRTSLTAGTYSVTITDANGCTGTISNITVSQPASAVSGTTVVTNVACNGGNTGAINLTPTGGTGPYTFVWSGGVTTEDRTSLAAGTYSVTITDANGCTGTISNITVTQPAVAVSGTTVVTNVACFGGNTGAINLTPTGGTGPYTFLWNNGATTEDRTSLAAGTYSVTITDANGCTGTISNITVTQPAAAVSGTTVVTNVACNGGNTGAINLTPTGGTGPYTFLWNSGATTEDRTVLAAGTYSVTITDANGCTGTVSNIAVTQPTALVASASSQTNVACFGGSNGAASVAVTGGTPGYTYSWAPAGGTAATATGLAAGTYTVTVTDANGCTATQSFTITQPAAAVSGTTVVTNVACNGGNTGAINLTPTGGTGPYTFLWNGGVTTEDRTGLEAGNYSVVITDANGCTATVNATVTQPAALVASASSQTNVACFGGSNGAASVAVTGGTPGYTYSWAPAGGTAATATGLAAGTYTVTVTDANGCTATQSFTITEPAAAVSGTTVVTNVACNGGNTGAINLTPTGGTGPYTFLWNGGVTTEDRTGLEAGNYSVVITDANGCTATVNATVTQPAALVASASSQTSVACFGGSNGAASVAVTGGTPGYTYSWAPAGGTAATATGLAAGTYTVTVTDANGCTATQSFTITEPAALVASASSQTNVACFGGSNGSATVAVTGGTGSYTYSWAPAGGTAATATGLAAGTYTVTVTDANGCTATQSFTITEPAAAVSGTTVVTNVACNGGNTGAINLTPTGGTGPYTFLWNGGVTTEDRTGLTAGNYSVVITDANGCTGTVNATVTQAPALVASASSQTNVACFGGSNGAASVAVTGGTPGYTYSWAPAGGTAATATGLAAGTYTVTVTDANGCQATQSFTITQPAAAVSGTTVVTNVACNGGNTGAINLTPTGGTGPYTFLWNGGVTTEDRTGLTAGNYSVVITDANGCTGTVNATVTQAPALVASASSQTNVACNGGANGSATVAVTGGTGSYTYSWAPAGGTAATATGLAAGTYTVTVTDANGCTATQSFTITQPAAVVINNQPQDDTVNTGDTATFTVNASNATGYQWQVSTDGTNWNDVTDGGTNPAYSGAATNTLTVTGVPVTFDGYQYRVIVNAGINCETTSEAATLNVNNELEAVDDDFSATTINEGVGGVAGDVTLNDLFNGAAVVDTDVTISVVNDGGMTGVTIAADGTLSVPASAEEGIYTITYSICDVANSTNCSTAEVTVVVGPPLGVKEFNAMAVTVYPNPAVNEVYIKVADISSHHDAKVVVYDMNGRMVIERPLVSELETINISLLESGIYIFNITSDMGKTTKRIIKTKTE